MRSSDMGLIRISLDFPIVWAFPESLFREGGVLANFQAFINVYKHYGPTAVDLDPRSKITEKTSWIQGLDPRSKIPGKTSWIQDPRFQDSRKNFLDPRSGSKIQDLRLQGKLLGSKIPRFQKKTSWIQGLDPRSKIQDYRKNLDPQQNLVSDLGKLCLRIQEVFSGILDLGSRPWIQKVFSVILDLGARPWIQEVFSVILDLGSRSTAMDP